MELDEGTGDAQTDNLNSSSKPAEISEGIKVDDNVDTEKNKADGGKEDGDPYQYTKRQEFTSEIFKVEISNLPRFGFKVCL